MHRSLNKLTAPKIKASKPEAKPYKLADGGGLYVLVHPNGGKYWQMKYRRNGKEQVLSLGIYPTVSIAAARKARDLAKEQLQAGIDPNKAKTETKRQERLRAANSFEAIAREWYEKQQANWTTKHRTQVIQSLEANIFPALGERPISDITPAELLDVLREIEQRGALEIASRVLQRCSAVFRYAIASARATANPAADLKGALTPPKKVNLAALKVEEMPEFMRVLDAYPCQLQTRLATKLLILTFVRTSELRFAEWSEFDFDDALWRIPAERMKMRVEHLVPLAPQTIELLQQLKEISTSDRLLFPGRSSIHKPISENTILFVIKRMGYKGRATGHGFRATASTALNEAGFNPDAIERQLAHGERDKVRAAYNRAQYLDERRRMMAYWASKILGDN